MIALALFGGASATACSSMSSASSASSVSSSSARYQEAVFADVDVTKDVAYGAGPDELLDVYEPRGDTADRRPAFVWVHGGGFVGGDKSDGPLIALPADFARSGYVAFSIEYRRTATAGCIRDVLPTASCLDAARAAIADAQDAVRFVRANASRFGVDPARVAIAGESAGGMTAAGVGTEADSDADAVEAWMSVSGGALDLGAIDGHDAPALLFSGTKDSFVPYQLSVDTEQALQRAGVPVVLHSLEGADHVPAQQYGDVFLRETRGFLYEHLDLAEANG